MMQTIAHHKDIKVKSFDTSHSCGEIHTRAFWGNWTDILKTSPLIVDLHAVIHDRYRPFLERLPDDTQTQLSGFPQKTTLSKLKYNEYELQIHSGLSLDIEITYEDGQYLVYNDAFGVYATGKSIGSAIRDFKQSFIEFYRNIVACSENVLGDSTLRFRELLKTFATLKIHG